MKRALPLGLAIAAGLLGVRAWAEPPPGEGLPPPGQELRQPANIPLLTPIVTIDDTRSHGPTARNWFDVEADNAFITGGPEPTLYAFTQQLSVGSPGFRNHQLRDLLSSISPLQLRVRTQSFYASSTGGQQGPLTVGLQYYAPIDGVSISSLVSAHFGIEAVAATPWLSGRHAVPPSPLGIINGVDTELASNGWSLRPASAYLRADLLVCGCVFLDLGVAPELFVPTVGPNETNGRFHVASGFSFARNRGTSTRFKVSFEYRGRVRLHAGDAPTAYWDSVGLGPQMDVGFLSLQLLATTNVADRPFDYFMFGLRLQAGRQKGGL